MSLYEIDRAATRARLDAITADGLRKLGDCARRSEELDKQVQTMLARQEREKQAMDDRAKPVTPDRPEPAPRPKPTTLVLGADELRATKRDEPKPVVRPGPAVPASASGGDGHRDAQRPQAPANVAGRPGAEVRAAGGRDGRTPEPQAGRAGEPPSTSGGGITHPTTPPATRRTLMLGAPEDREQPPAENAKPRSRRPAAEQDDDMSGRTWLR